MAEMFIARFADTCLESLQPSNQYPDISRKEAGTPPSKYNQRSKKLTVQVPINKPDQSKTKALLSPAPWSIYSKNNQVYAFQPFGKLLNPKS